MVFFTEDRALIAGIVVGERESEHWLRELARVTGATTRFLQALAQPPEVGDPLLAGLRGETESWPEPAASVVRLMLDGDGAGLCRLLSPQIDEVSGDPALSPERSPMPRVPPVTIATRAMTFSLFLSGSLIRRSTSRQVRGGPAPPACACLRVSH